MARIARADVSVHADTKPFIKDLEELKGEVKKLKLKAPVNLKLAKGARKKLQEQLDALKPLNIKAKIKLEGLGELKNILADQASILGEENQLNRALQEEAKARREIANATAAQSRAESARLNQINAALRLEAQELRLAAQKERLARQQAAALARQRAIMRDQRNILGLQVREWRFLGEQIFGFNRNLDVTRKAFIINAAASETLLGSLTNLFRRAINLRKVAVQLGASLGVAFAAGAQAVGAIVSAMGRAVTAAGVLAGIGLIAIGIKLQLNDAEVAAKLQNLKDTFTGVFTRASASLKPVLSGFFDDISAGLLKQEGAFTGFFNRISGPLGRVGKALSDILASEAVTKLIGQIGEVTGNFLDKVADKLPAIFDGAIKIGSAFVQAGKDIRKAFGPGIFSGLTADKVVKGIQNLTKALVSAGAGVRAFKTAFGQALGGVGIALKGILAEIGKSGPALFQALGPIVRAFAVDLGVVVQALIRFASVVLPIAKKEIIGFADAFSTNLSKALDILAKPLAETVKHISLLGEKLSPLLPIFAQIAADLEPVVSGIVRFGIAISPLVVEVARFVEKLASGIGKGLKPFVDAAVKLGEILSTVLTPVFRWLNDHGITEFVGIIAGAVIGVLAFVAAIKSLGGIIGIFTKKDKGKTAALLAENAAMKKGGIISRTFKGALSLLGDAAKTVGNAFKKMIPESVFKKFSSLGTRLLDQIKNPFTAIRLQLINLGDFLGKIGTKIGSAFSGLGSKITGPFKAIGGFFSGLGSKIVGAFSGIGGKIASVFSGIGGKIAGFFAPVLNFFKGIGAKIAGVFKGGGAVSGFAKTFSGLGATVGKVLGPLARVGGVIARFAGPIGIIVTLILEWRTVWDTLVKGFEIFKTAVQGVIAGIDRIVGGFKKLFSGDILGGLGDIFGGLKDILVSALKGAFDGLVNVLSGLWTILWHTLESIPVIGPLFAKIHELITAGFNFLKGAFSGAGDFLSGVWNAIKTGASAAWNFIKAVFGPVISFFGSVFSGIGTIVSGVWNFIKSIFSAGISFIGSIISGIVQFFSNPIEGIKTIISGAWEFIKSVFSAGVAFIGSVFSGIGTIVSGVWEFIKSLFSAGVSAIGSILSGIGSFFSAAFSVVSSIVSGVFNTVRSIIGGVVDWIGSKIQGIGNFFSSAFDKVKSVVSGAIDFIKGIIEGVVGTVSKIADKIKSIFSDADEGGGAAPAPKVDQAAVNAAAEQVRQQSEAILAALKELGPKVQAELANVTAIISAGFANLGTAIGTSVTTIATTVGAALTTMATNLTTTMATLSTNLITQLTTLATTATTTLITTIQTALTSLTTSFTTVGASLTAAFTAIFTDLGTQATTFFGTTLPATVLAGTTALQTNLTTGLTTAFQGAFSAIGPVIDAAMVGAFANASTAAATGMSGIVAAVQGGVEGIIGAVAPVAAAITQPFEDGFKQALSATQKGIDAIVNAVKAGAEKIRGLGQSYYDAGAYIGQRLADGMNSKVDAVNQAATNLAKAASTPLPHSPAKEGPLSGHGDPLYSGHAIGERLANGIEQRRKLIADTIDRVAAEIRDRAAKAGFNVEVPTGDAIVSQVTEAIRRNQDPIARALANLNVTLRDLPTAMQASVGKGMQVGFAGGAGGAPGTALTGRFDRTIGGSILKQDTQASFGGNAAVRSQNLVQIRPGQINVTLQGINDPREFLNQLSKELLTQCTAR